MSQPSEIDLSSFIRSIPDYPKPGILFRDITPLLASAEAFAATTSRLADHYQDAGIDLVVAVEARGFLFAGPIAEKLNAGLTPVRKPGKLPFKTISQSYDLEYGTDTLEMHVDGVAPGLKVLVVDDLLATGGTVGACCKLLEDAGAIIAGCCFVVELAGLQGRKKLGSHEAFSLITYE